MNDEEDDMDDIENEVEILKIVFVGETGVGKTSIFSQFIDDVFHESFQASTGATYHTKSFLFDDGKELKLDIWDTAGQEKYRALTQMFYKDANAAILVYDITNQDSFEELQNYWVNQIKESSSSNIIIVIVANKSDLIGEEEVNEEDARKFAEEVDAIFCCTSAKNKVGIDDIFVEIVKKHTGRTDFKILTEEVEEKDEKERQDSHSYSVSGSLKLTMANSYTDKKKKKCC